MLSRSSALLGGLPDGLPTPAAARESVTSLLISGMPVESAGAGAGAGAGAAAFVETDEDDEAFAPLFAASAAISRSNIDGPVFFDDDDDADVFGADVEADDVVPYFWAISRSNIDGPVFFDDDDDDDDDADVFGADAEEDGFGDANGEAAAVVPLITG